MDLLKRPSTDFNAVRDGRQSMPLYVDVDLTTARSISGNNPLILNIAGNSFFTDADNTNGGNAIVHFQDTNLGNSSAPFFVSPGFIANVGFTQLLIENTAQAGKRMRIFYGVDIDFQAGINSSQITGTVKISDIEPLTPPSFFKSNTALTAVTPETIIAPAANINGVILYEAAFCSINTVGMPLAGLVTKNAAPASVVDGNLIVSTDNGAAIAGSFYGFGTLKQPLRIPAGLGLYWIATNTESSGLRRASYRIL